ncbi:siderophore-interacting protein [Rhodococcus sp. KBS0724]|uniref:siderophore-interacting protein n=1 Tax=Rhodococcus sp. KBS0724 TaxID=1179674 RepID=UPI00110E6739|nr:siderophore-interacting protein [Rhodococcus sp. KBS0724]TSD49908.1 siderophore-interacting protein [Rhodococcus sp. KBS0724]
MTTYLTVTSSEPITPSLRRVWFHSDDLSAFVGSVSTDRYVKLVFPKPGVVYPEPLDVRALRGTMAPEDLPVVRTYTAIYPDIEAGTVAIDFVIHGDEGVAGPWAATAQPGDTLMVNGPGGRYAPDPAADWHLLVGDESAVPAISAALAALADAAPDAVARVVVEVDSAAHEPPLAELGPTGAEIVFVHRDANAGNSALVDSVRNLGWLPGRVQVFAHGEADAIMHGLRPYLLSERGLLRDQVSISGYWRRGSTEEGFREWKSEMDPAGGRGRGRRRG